MPPRIFSTVHSSILGSSPDEREINTHLRYGVVNLDKPSGPTSHQVASWVKEIFGAERVGHGGTLDPNVTGVLPIGLNDATRLLGTLLHSDKEYVVIMKLYKDIPYDKLNNVMKEFVGEIYQFPPVQSAVKREMRVRCIYNITILEKDKERVLFKVRCQAGTYIRTLCEDVGLAIGVGGEMLELRRIKSGPFSERNSVKLHELKDAYVRWKEEGDEIELRRVVQPMERLLEPFKKIVIRDSAIDALCHGADLAIPGIMEVNESIKKGDIVALMSVKGEGIAIGRALMNSSDIMDRDKGMAVDMDRVFMSPGTYPRVWKSRCRGGPVR